MKCPQCGYFNLPGAPTCGRCRVALTETTGKETPVPFSDLYPPRAKNRSVREQLRAPLQQAAGRFRPLPERGRVKQASPWDGANPLAGRDFMPWVIASAAVLPGTGHLIQRQMKKAGFLLGATLFLFLMIVLYIRTPMSNLLGWALLALSVYSVWSAADLVFPAADNEDGLRSLRSLRLFLMSLGIVASTVFLTLGAFSHWYALWEFRGDQAAPQFLSGDGLLVRRLSHPEQVLRRGDVAVYFVDGILREIPRTERIVGLPGDRIAASESQLWVNGSLVPKEHLPFTFEPHTKPMNIVVPKGMVCLWRGVGGNVEERGDRESYLLVSSDRIQGQAVAIYQPPERRRWFR